MTDQIKTISDKANFEKILKKYFQNNNAFLKTKNGDLKIEFWDYSDNNAAFKIPLIRSINGNCLIFTRDNNCTIHALMKFNKRQEGNIFLFIVDKFQIIYRAREEERKSLDLIGQEKSKNIIFVTNLISYSIIQNSLSMETKKIERIKDFIQKQMSEAFNYIKIFFYNEGKGDSRMQYFYKNKKPMFIPQINNNISGSSDTEKHNFYINNIYLKDHFLQSKKEYISEISVPLLYKLKMPYGYIQVNNTSILTSSTLVIVKKFAISIDELLNKENVFPKSEEKLIVSNISKNGLGIVFKERKHIRYFKENNLVYFDILLPENKIASIMAMVRNITIMENNVIMVGCSIEEIDALSEVNYEEFVNSLSEAEGKYEEASTEEPSIQTQKQTP